MADTMFEAHLDSRAVAVRHQPPVDVRVDAAGGIEIREFAGRRDRRAGTGGTAIGVQPGYVAAFAAAAYGYYILPTYPSDLATIQFDRSGTTKIGKYVINHSFIIPGLIGVSTSCLVGYLIAASRGYL